MMAQRDKNKIMKWGGGVLPAPIHVYLNALYLHHCNVVTFIMCQVRSVAHTVLSSCCSDQTNSEEFSQQHIHLALFGLQNLIKSSRADRHIKRFKSTDVSEANTISIVRSMSEILVYLNHLTWLSAQECFLEFCHHETTRHVLVYGVYLLSVRQFCRHTVK